MRRHDTGQCFNASCLLISPTSAASAFESLPKGAKQPLPKTAWALGVLKQYPARARMAFRSFHSCWQSSREFPP